VKPQLQIKQPLKEPNQMFQHKIPQLNPMRPTQNMKGTENLQNNFKHPTAF